jgi:hypothetical protein
VHGPGSVLRASRSPWRRIRPTSRRRGWRSARCRSIKLLVNSRYFRFLCVSWCVHFFQGYALDRRIGFKEEGPSGQCTTRSTHRDRNSTLLILGQQEKKTHANYSPSLHLPPRESSTLKRPAAFHSTASDRMLRMTVDDDGVAPSNTTSFRCLQRHQHTRATLVHKSRMSAALPRQDCNQSESKTP